MNLSRATLAKIYLSFRFLPLPIDGRISESADGGVIYLQTHPFSPGCGSAIFAVGKGKGAIPVDEPDDIKDYAVYIVLSCDLINASLFSELEEMDIRWQQSGGAFRIEVVADVGKDPAGETRYNYCGFDDVDMFVNAIKRELVQDAKTDLNFETVSGLKMRITFRKYLAKCIAENHRESATLCQINQKLKDARVNL